MSMFRPTITTAWTVEVETARATRAMANAISSLNGMGGILPVARYKQDGFWLGKEDRLRTDFGVVLVARSGGVVMRGGQMPTSRLLGWCFQLGYSIPQMI